MKKLLTVILILVCSISFGQVKKTRVFNGYTVEYNYCDTVYSFAHEGTKRIIYFASKVQVYKDGQKIGSEINGVYSPDQSRKDDPEQWIIKAKNINQ